jgi:NAD(P)-dependent dehydrogenase (short-subunit alcohol dehydrogenase family)
MTNGRHAMTAGRVAGRKAVVTGSGGATGGAIAHRLAEEGADIALNDRLADRYDARRRPSATWAAT